MRKKNYTLKQAQRDLPSRRKKDNKTRGRKCLMIAGSTGMWGAAVLAATAAARAGAGYTYIYDIENKFCSVKHPDFLISSTEKNFDQFTSICLGPGVRDIHFLHHCILQLIRIDHKIVILDAGALDALSLLKKSIRLPHSWILTPHEGEMGRLLEMSGEEVRKNRKKSILKLQKKFGCNVILKGSHTLIADGHSLFQIQSGNSSLAKAGTGDVLAGIITGFLSQGLTPLHAACLGVFVHGAAADQWIEDGNDQLSLLASDLNKRLPKTLAKIRRALVK